MITTIDHQFFPLLGFRDSKWKAIGCGNIKVSSYTVEKMEFPIFLPPLSKLNALLLGITVAFFFGVTVFFLLYGPRFSLGVGPHTFFWLYSRRRQHFCCCRYSSRYSRRREMRCQRWIDKRRRSHRHHFFLLLWWQFFFAICYPLGRHLFSCILAIITHVSLSSYLAILLPRYLALAHVASVRASWVCASSFYLY